MIENYFDLTRQPFRLGTDTAFFFESETHGKAMSYIKFGMQQGEGFVLITGDTGVGKSMLVEYLLQDLDPNEIVAAQMSVGYVQEGGIIDHMMQAFRIEACGEGSTAQYDALEAFLIDQVTFGLQAILIIDEAQNLTKSALEEVRIISNMQARGHSLLQVFLIGQNDLNDLISDENMDQLRQRIIASYKIMALSREETATYIDHRMVAAGWGDEQSAFSEDAHAAIHEFTGGVPRQINALCSRVLLQTAIDEAAYVDSAIVRTVIEELRDERQEINTPKNRSEAKAEPHDSSADSPSNENSSLYRKYEDDDSFPDTVLGGDPLAPEGDDEWFDNEDYFGTAPQEPEKPENRDIMEELPYDPSAMSAADADRAVTTTGSGHEDSARPGDFMEGSDETASTAARDSTVNTDTDSTDDVMRSLAEIERIMKESLSDTKENDIRMAEEAAGRVSSHGILLDGAGEVPKLAVGAEDFWMPGRDSTMAGEDTMASSTDNETEHFTERLSPGGLSEFGGSALDRLMGSNQAAQPTVAAEPTPVAPETVTPETVAPETIIPETVTTPDMLTAPEMVPVPEMASARETVPVPETTEDQLDLTADNAMEGIEKLGNEMVSMEDRLDALNNQWRERASIIDARLSQLDDIIQTILDE